MNFVRKAKKTHPLFLTDNIKMNRLLTKIFYILFQGLKVLLIKICKMQSLDPLFLVGFISFYISRYHFSQVFRTSFNIIWNSYCMFLLPKIFPIQVIDTKTHQNSALVSLKRFYRSLYQQQCRSSKTLLLIYYISEELGIA